MTISRRHKIVSIFSKRDRFDFGRDLIRSHFDIIVPVPDIHYHVLLGPHGHHVLPVGGKGHHIDPIFVPGKFRNLLFFGNIPNSNAGCMPALPGHHVAAIVRKGQRGYRFSRRINHMILTIFSGVVEDDGAASRVGHQAS